MRKTLSTLKEIYLNTPAFFGLVYIISCFVVVLLGYSIMMDKTPNAEDGHPMVRKLQPLSSAYFLKIKHSFEVEKKNFLYSLYFGTESEYSIVPLNGSYLDTNVLFIQGDTLLFYKTLDSRGHDTLLSKPLIECVVNINTSLSESYNFRNGKNYLIRENDYLYLNSNDDTVSITKEDLLSEFYAKNLEKRYFILGTDEAGRDMYSKLIFGTRIALLIGLASVLISLVVGVTLGAVAGFFGGTVDSVISWLITVFFAIPSIMWVIAISFVLGSRELWVVFVAVGLTTWVDIARLVRGQIISIKQSLYIDAARALGYTNGRIVFNHILPNVIDPLIIASTSNFATAILVESGLSFLGIGVRPPTPSWGYMIYEGFKTIGSPNSLHIILVPCLAISLTILAFNLLGNGLRDALDPKKTFKR
jgi:peptide/nickel transport system permease protein